MKKILMVVFFLTGMIFNLPCHANENWEQSARKVLSLSRQMDKRTFSSETFARQDRAALEKRMADLKKKISLNKKALDQKTQRLNLVSEKRAGLALRYQNEMADMKTVEGIFRTSLRQALTRYDHSVVAAMYPEKRQILKQLMGRETPMGLKEMQVYATLLFDDMTATGKIEKKKSKVVGPNGKVMDVTLYRAGGFFLGFPDHDTAYFVLPQAGQPGVSIKAPGRMGKRLKEWFSGESGRVVLDITSGTAIRAAEQKPGLDSWIEAGGMLLYPILVAGGVGSLLVLFKAFHLLILKRFSKKEKQRIFERIGEGPGETGLSKIKRCPAASVMEAGFSYKGRDPDRLDNLVEEAIMIEQGKQERFISIIGVLASIAPLLGLLGTVTGMINTFRAITIFGTGDPRMMSTGISEALVTTQAGLGVAIPLILAHHFLKRRVAVLVTDMESCAMSLIARLSTR